MNNIVHLQDGTLWFSKHRISFAVGWHPNWKLSDVGILHLRKNDWVLGYPCLDITARILKLNINLTFWNMPFQKPHPYDWYE